MADIRYQVIMHNSTSIPRDDAVNVLYYENNFPDTVLGNMDDIAAAYDTLALRLNTNYQTMTIKAYDGPGQPIEEKNYNLFGGAGGQIPTEVALCLSYSADDDTAGTPKRRGRIYLPWASSLATRPSATVIGQVLAFGELLAQIGTAGNTTWKMFSRVDNAFRKIESISCDNEWDTQRRRGMRATVRTRRDVQ